LLAVILVFGLMRKHNEMTALRSSGVSHGWLLVPVLAMGVALSLVHFFLSEVVIPTTAARSNRIWIEEVKKRAAVVSRNRDIWLKGTRQITHIRYYDPAKRNAHGVAIYQFDERFQLARRLDAKVARFREGRWSFYQAIEQTLIPETGQYAVTVFDNREEPFAFQPDELRRVVKKSEEMSFWELLAYVRTIEQEGYDATAYRVDLQAKLAFPWVCLLMSLAATGIGPRGAVRREGLALAVASGIGIAFLYWFSHSFCVSLGYGGVLPPFLAAWTSNLVFLSLSALILLQVD
jgi:lipopolysaccharide export system permease protein